MIISREDYTELRNLILKGIDKKYISVGALNRKDFIIFQRIKYQDSNNFNCVDTRLNCELIWLIEPKDRERIFNKLSYLNSDEIEQAVTDIARGIQGLSDERNDTNRRIPIERYSNATIAH